MDPDSSVFDMAEKDEPEAAKEDVEAEESPIDADESPVEEGKEEEDTPAPKEDAAAEALAEDQAKEATSFFLIQSYGHITHTVVSLFH